MVERLHKNAKKSEALRRVVVAGVGMSKKEKREKELIMNRIEDFFDKGVDKVNRKSKRKVFFWMRECARNVRKREDKSDYVLPLFLKMFSDINCMFLDTAI